MASTEFINQAYLAYFGRPADAMAAVNGALATEEEMMSNFGNSAESLALYGADADYAFINAIYNNIFGRDADVEGATWWLNEILEGRLNKAEAALNILKGADNVADQTVIALKLDACQAFTVGLNEISEVIAYSGNPAAESARLFIASVETTAPTQAAVDAAIVAAGQAATKVAFTMTVAQDIITGSELSDTITARVAQNANGEQTNQLATGDVIDGGTGTDTLNAKVIAASALNAGPAMAITPETTDVEKVNITALTSATAAGAEESVELNAKYMNGLDLVSSTQSDASLIISNLTTLTDSGVYEDRRYTDSVTIRMDHTGNDDAVIAESDLTVLFDQDYLLAGSSSQSDAAFYLLDEKAELNGLAERLDNINVDGISFTITIDGVTTPLTISDRDAWAAGDLNTHEKFVAALQDNLQALIDAGYLPAGSTLTLSYTYVNSDGSVLDDTYLDDGSISDPIPAIVLTVPGASVQAIGFTQVEDALGNYDIYGNFGSTSSEETEPVTATIELEKVGRAGEGGDLTVGGMATDLTNTFDENSTLAGVEQFNITVSGDTTQFSSLASLQATNNTLETVNVTWATGSLADLTIGNGNTEGDVDELANDAADSDDDMTTILNNALKDVKVFNAANNNSSTLTNGTVVTNDVHVNAYVSDEAVDKYMDLTDTDIDPTEDNADFDYSFGAGNDSLNINISKTNLAQSGTTNREDFSMSIKMGAGNDTVETQIGDGTGVATDAWYINSELNDNLGISAGAGNDTVRTFGAGSWNIDLGTGNDVVYSDNSGNQENSAVDTTTDAEDAADTNYNSGRAVWVLNTDDQDVLNVLAAERDIDDLVSDANGDHSLYQSTVTISLRGVEASVVVNDYNTTDLEYNNIIKSLIANNEFLSDLIVAEDGPANTLVIRSLTDGVFDATDLTVSVASNTISTLSATTLAAFNAANGTNFTTQAAVQEFVDDETQALDASADYNTALANDGADELVGAASTAVTASVITDGTGQDTIVLSTSSLDTEIVNLTADATADLIYNATDVVINGLEVTDTVVLSSGEIFTNMIGTMVVDAGTLAADVFSISEIDAAGTLVIGGFETGTDTLELSEADLDALVAPALYAAGDTGATVEFVTIVDGVDNAATLAGAFIYNELDGTLYLDVTGDTAYTADGDVFAGTSDDIAIAVIGTIVDTDIAIVA